MNGTKRPISMSFMTHHKRGYKKMKWSSIVNHLGNVWPQCIILHRQEYKCQLVRPVMASKQQQKIKGNRIRVGL